MAEFKVKTPDGSIMRIQGPDDATDDELQSFAAENWKPKGLIDTVVDDIKSGINQRAQRERERSYAASNAAQRVGLERQQNRLSSVEQQQVNDSEAAQRAFDDSSTAAAGRAIDYARDIGIGLTKGAINTGVKLPLALTGLGIDATGMRDTEGGRWHRSGLQEAERWNKGLEGLKSSAGQARGKQIEDATGFTGTLLAIDSPAALADQIAESAVGTGVVGVGAGAAVKAAMPRLLKAAETAGLSGAKKAQWIADRAQKIAIATAAAGEGAQSGLDIAGTAQAAGRSLDQYGMPALAAAAGTAAIGGASGAIGRRAGIGDIEADIGARLAGVKGSRTGQAAWANRIAAEGVKEGLFEELPQSVQEAAWENVAMGRPWDEGLGKAGALGFAAGAGMGGGHAALSRGDVQGDGDAVAKPPSVAPIPSLDDIEGAPPPAAPPKQSEAEKALLTPREITALDRVELISGEERAARERLADLSDLQYGPTFDGERAELSARAEQLRAERQALTVNWPKAAMGAPTSFSTEAGVRLDAQYALMDADALVTSHDADLRANGAYPKELQPRERERAASEMQVSGIVSKLDPARLGLSADAATGAPIVGADGLVESGNARTIALKRVYSVPGQKAEDYKQFLKTNAAQFGIAPESVDAMPKPVLVRVRNTPVDRAEFARQANASTVAQMSPIEQARADASRMDVLDDLRPDDSGDFINSREFIRRFMAKLPSTEHGAMIDAAGNLSQSGYARIRNAVLAKAYGESPVMQRMTESLDDHQRNISKALLRAAPDIAKARQDIADGAAYDVDVTPDLLAAVDAIARIRADGRTVRDELAQVGVFGDRYTPETRAIMEFMDANARSPRKIADYLKGITEALEVAGNPNQAAMFGGQAPAKADLIAHARRAVDGTGEAPAFQRGQASPQWVRFSQETGTLGIPRAQMPQVKGEHRGALIQFLNGKGIPHRTIEALPAGRIKPTQAEYAPAKVERWGGGPREGSDRSVLISRDGYILDGHHQWVAARQAGEPVKAIVFDADIRPLLAAVHAFPSSHRSEGAERLEEAPMFSRRVSKQESAAMDDLFATARPQPQTLEERKKDNYKPPAFNEIAPPDVAARVGALVEKWKDNLPETKISDEDRAKAEDMLISVIDAAKRDEPWFDARVREIGKQFLGSQLGSTKKIGRAAIKLVKERFNVAEMKDIVRATIVIDQYDTQAQAALNAIASKFEITQVNNKTALEIRAADGIKAKNKGVSPEGYSDVTAFVRLPGGGIAEVQINIPEMLSAKANAHVLYEGSRVVEKDPARQDEYAELRDGQRDAYQAALAAATDRMKYASSELQPLDTGSAGSSTSTTLSSSNRNHLPSGNPTNSSPPKEDMNLQPSGNLSGTLTSSTSNQIIALFDRLREGDVTLNEFKDGFSTVVDGKDAIKAELSALTKDAIFKRFPSLTYRYKNEKKADVVDAAYRSILDSFVLGDSVQWRMGEKYEDVIRGYVERTTDESLRESSDKVKAAKSERDERRKAAAAGMENPTTLDDYKRILAAKAEEIGEGATFSQARMAMTPDQRARFDELSAEQTRGDRKARADQQKTELRVAAATTEGQIVETKHTKTGEPLFVVKAAERVEREVYNQWNATAKRLGGWYSSFRGNGAVPGFQFKARANAEAFIKYLGGNVEQAKEVAQSRRDAFDDDKSQSAAERLNEMADRLDNQADETLAADRKTNTARRARMAASIEANANAGKAMAQTMRNIAAAIESGKAKFLDRVRQKVQIERMQAWLRTARDAELRAKYPSYAEQEKRKGEPSTAETADYAAFPSFTAYRSDLARMGRRLLEIDGAKQLGTRLLKVANDVTEAYKKFAKENLHKVSTFKTRDGKDAVFRTADDAEAAIANSGFNGKATTISFKRGEHLVIMGPEMAKESGLWSGDDDKRITLAPDFAEELVAKAKGRDIGMPWTFEAVAADRARLRAMGIETPAEFRAALREFIAMREAPKAPDRIKELERKLVGRANDGLDFFPTPAETAQAMIDAAELEEGMAVLEPSAGWGHIAEKIRESGVDPDVVELSGDRRELLEAKGFRLVGSDFMDMSPRDFTYGDVFRDKDGREGVMRGSGGIGSNRVGFIPDGSESREWVYREDLTGVRKSGSNSGYDRILMNPPFGDRRDAEHVQHAYSLLKPGGRIVALMGEGVFFGQDKKAQAFRDWLESVGGTSEKLEGGTFLDPSLPVNTGANARMVVIKKLDRGITLREEEAVYNVNEPDSITGDLFQGTQDALPDDQGKNPRAQKGSAQRRASRVLAVREAADTPGIYHVTTQLVTVGKRSLPVNRVKSWDDAAKAFAHLSRYAVEHLDGLVTDKNGKPLAVIGSFKGAPTQTSVYVSTVLMELARIDGAANLWLAHNHPSGTTTLSGADRSMSLHFMRALAGSSVTYHGLAAVARNGKEVWLSSPQDDNMSVVPYEQEAKYSVPIVEREIVNHNAVDSISNPDDAQRIAVKVAGDQPGILFLTAQNYLTAFVPFEPEAMGKLRSGDRLMRLFNAAAKSGGVGAIVAMPDGKVSRKALNNLTGALGSIDVKVLDGIEYASALPQSASSIARKGWDANESAGPAFLSRGSARPVEALFMTGYHGSPHDHDGFDSSKIGTGEGAQAYGWGHYFASSKSVAQWYRDKLARSNDKTTAIIRILNDESKSTIDSLKEHGRKVANEAPDKNAVDDLSVARAMMALERIDAKIKTANANRAYYGKDRLTIDELLDYVENGENRGRLYQVELAPEPDEYLDWDKPLSEQSEKVKAALGSGDEVSRDARNKWVDAAWGATPGKPTGGFMYQTLADKLGSKKAASEYLLSLGIRGIKYLDGSSRHIMSEVWKVKSPSGMWHRFTSKQDADAYVNGREGYEVVEPTANYNYVIFDDADVEITAKFRRGTSLPGGISVASVEQATQKLLAGLKNPPKVKVVWSPRELPFSAPDDARGAFHGGTMYLVAGGIASSEELRDVVAHEMMGHYGLRGFFGSALDGVLLRIHSINPLIQTKAAAWYARNRDLIAELKSLYGMNDVAIRSRAIEEAMAEVAQDGRQIGGLQVLAIGVQRLLRRIGMNTLADQIEAKTDAEALLVLKKAGLFVKKGRRLATAFLPRAPYPQWSRGMEQDMEAQAKWLEGEAKARGYRSVDDLLDRNYDLFERLALLWRKKNPVEEPADAAMLSRVSKYWKTLRKDTKGEIARAQEAGYDGIVLNETDREGLAGDVFVAFSPTQIKSAISNTGEFSDTNPDIRFSRAPTLIRQGQTATDRANEIIMRSAASWRPVDALMKGATKALRVDQLAKAAIEKLPGRALREAEARIPGFAALAERVRGGMVSDYGVPEAVIDRRTIMQGHQRVMMRKTGVLIDKLATLTREESRVAYEWMNNDDPQAAEWFEKQLPPESVKTLNEIKLLIDKLSREAVRLGQLSPEAYKANRFAYLHRSYVKHTFDLTKGEAERRQRVIAILGDQYKGRGIEDAAPMSKIRAAAPIWWQRKLKAGKADAGVVGERFIRLERRAPIGAGTVPLPGIGKQVNARLLEVAWWPAGEPIPTHYAGWDQAGTWLARDVKGANVVMWRDFSKEERVAMGEIDEARYAIAKTLHGMVHDVETGRYLEWLAINHAKKEGEEIPGTVAPSSERMRDAFGKDEWVRVPTTTVEGTSVARYGLLAGRYLPGPIWNDVRQVVAGNYKPFGDTYATVLRAWKASKTALSPAVHTNNVMANMVMADWHDVTAGHMTKALRILLAASNRDGKGLLGRVGNVAASAGISDAEAARAIVERYQDSGGNIGTWATSELQREQLAPLLEALEKEIATTGNSPSAQVGAGAALQQALRLNFPAAWDAAKATKTGAAVVTEAGNMMALYEAEDQVFRLAAWLRAKEEGATDLEAGKIARKSFLDYHINAPWVQMMRGTAFPFIAFTYRAVPMLLDTAANKPWKIMKLAAFGGLLNALGYMLSGGDEDDERAYLPEEKAGRVWGLVPKLVRMPWNDAHDSPVFLDIRRFVPVGDVFDTGQTHAALPIIPAAMPAGPLALLAELMANKSQFTGREITRETDTPTEQAGKVFDHLWKAFSPNLPMLPGTHSFTSVANAGGGKTDTFGRELSVGQALAGSVGVKLGSYPTDVLRDNARRTVQARLREIDEEIGRLRRERMRNGIDDATFRDRVAEQQKKKRTLIEAFRRKAETVE